MANVVFKNRNQRKVCVLACAFYIHRHCWDCDNGRIDPRKCDEFHERLVEVTASDAYIDLGMVGGDHSGRGQRQALADLMHR